MQLLGALLTLVAHFLIICAGPNGSKLRFVPITSKGLVELDNEVKWMVNMSIMVYFNKTRGNVTSGQFLGDNNVIILCAIMIPLIIELEILLIVL